MSRRVLPLMLLCTIAAAIAFGLFAMHVSSARAGVAVTFTVNNSGDASDGTPGDGTCDTLAGPPIVCTLRAAIEETNALNGPNVINFTATNTWPLSVLPTITERVTIDASANFDGFSIDASNAGTDGLTLGSGSSGSIIRGLNIFSAPGNGLVIDGGAGHTIGGDPAIGAAPAGQGNTIHGNGGNGISITTGSLGGHTIQGNRIGTTPVGTSPDANGGDGIDIADGIGHAITIGGFPNIISDNVGDGIRICCGDWTGSVISHNTISNNGGGGVQLESSTHGVRIGPANTITGNTGQTGIYITGTDSDKNTITQNSIYANTGLGIDLDDGTGLADVVGCTTGTSGPNDCIPFPTLVGLFAAGKLTGTACANCRVEVFLADNTPPDQNDTFGGPHGEGWTYLASGTADGSGNFSILLPCGQPSGISLTATATNVTGSTSEFSRNAGPLLGTGSCATPTPTNTATPTPTSTPTATPPPIITPLSVGGISLDPRLPGSSGGDADLLAGAIAGAMGVIALGGAAWYARRRQMSR